MNKTGKMAIYRIGLIPVLLALLLAAALTAFQGAAHSAPRFTDKDTALELAQVLDKGVFRGSMIISTFVHSPATGDYQVKVVLDNGAELNWTMRQIRQWSHDHSLTLSRNRVLVFPMVDTNEYGVLDKIEFTKLALRSRVFAKRYKDPDILTGQVIQYGIHAFNLVEVLNLAPSRDFRGDEYRYAFDLENGQRILLTYLDAWETLKNKGLLPDDGGQPVMRMPYRLLSIASTPLRRNVANGTGRFSISMTFDRPVLLKPEHFPYRLYEGRPGKGKKALDNNFVLEVTSPNSILPVPVKTLDSAEFLYQLKVVSDDRNQNRVLLLAMIAPEVLTTPPEVEIDGKTVNVIFTKVEDQSVFDRKALRNAELRRRQEKILAPILTKDEVERRKLYRQHMETGVGQLDKARAQSDIRERFEILQAAMANFQEAALHASSDPELEEALRQRNDLTYRVPQMLIDHVHRGLNSGGVSDKSSVLSLLKAAKTLTRDVKVIKAIEETERKLGGG